MGEKRSAFVPQARDYGAPRRSEIRYDESFAGCLLRRRFVDKTAA